MDNFDLEEAREILGRTPGVLSVKLAGICDGWSLADEGPGTWNPRGIVGHLIHGEQADWIPRAKIILAREDSVRFEPFDRFAQDREPQDRSLEDLLSEFERHRASNLEELTRLDLAPEDLDRRGEHPEFGHVTLGQLLATWVVHDLGHLAQIDRVMAKRYRQAAGPWAQYLPILTDRN